MESAFRHRDRGDNPNRFKPKDNNAARETIGKNGGPIPVFGKFPAETKKTISVSSGFNKTNNSWFVRAHKTEDTSGGITRRNTPAIPANDFSCIHGETR